MKTLIVAILNWMLRRIDEDIVSFKRYGGNL